MTARAVAALGRRHDGRWWLGWAGRAALMLLIVAGLFLAREYLGRDAADPGLQRVRLLNAPPPPPPPPPPKEKPREEPRPEEKVEITAPHQATDEPPPMDDRLGLDAEADGTGDAFGLAAKPGGRSVTTLGPPGRAAGPGGPARTTGPPSRALEQGYNRMLDGRLEAWLNRREELQGRRWKATADLWISASGAITRVRFAPGGADAELERQLATALTDMPPLTAPPAGYRLPVRVRLASSERRGG